MEENEEKQVKKVDNSNYRERFQFMLKVNDHIICQRYFRINRYNSDSLCSEELLDTLRGVVQTIKSDLESKSRIYLWATQGGKTKLTGFADNDGIVQNEPTYLETPPKEWGENEFVDPWEVTFQFMFLVDDHPVFSEIWDGSKYPKYVRNSVDITNSWSQYPMVRIMNADREDIVVDTIRKICAACSMMDGEKRYQYTKSDRYTVDETFAEKSGLPYDYSKKYYFTAYDKDYVNGWRVYCAKKYGNIRM